MYTYLHLGCLYHFYSPLPILPTSVLSPLLRAVGVARGVPGWACPDTIHGCERSCGSVRRWVRSTVNKADGKGIESMRPPHTERNVNIHMLNTHTHTQMHKLCTTNMCYTVGLSASEVRGKAYIPLTQSCALGDTLAHSG